MENRPIISEKSPIVNVYCKEEFNQLTNKEKRYTYHIYKGLYIKDYRNLVQ